VVKRRARRVDEEKGEKGEKEKEMEEARSNKKAKQQYNSGLKPQHQPARPSPR
jgi:hypothetical protein